MTYSSSPPDRGLRNIRDSVRDTMTACSDINSLGMTMRKTPTVAITRRYAVLNTDDAKRIASLWLQQSELDQAVAFGLPEVDDRSHVWRVPLLSVDDGRRVGEVVIDANSTLVVEQQTTSPVMIEQRLLHRDASSGNNRLGTTSSKVILSALRNTIGHGDSEELLQVIPAESVDLIFTSPPYYNARPEYTDYVTYEAYLLKLRKIIQQCHRVLNEGRMFVMNISPVLIRRQDRSHSSKRIAVPFDVHRIFTEEGFDFIDDIIWVKPEGAGWATGRGRRFAADRNPMQYKPVPVTEYVLVYRKHTDKLIDWHIRSHPDRTAVEESKIDDGYERTNIWHISPTWSSDHPAVFPLGLAERVVRYYSFKNDVVLDPFAGAGTTGAAAAKLGRRFVLLERDEVYINVIRKEALKWLGKTAEDIYCLENFPVDPVSGARTLHPEWR